MKRRRIWTLLLTDIIAINFAYALALFIRFDGSPEIFDYFRIGSKYMFVITIIKVLSFRHFKLYKSLWEYASIDEMVEIVIAAIIGNAISILYLLIANADFPRSIYIMVPILDMVLIGVSRFFYRVFRRLKYGISSVGDFKRILIIGAGSAGVMVLKELRNHESLNSKPVAFIDDDYQKNGTSINRIPVVGNRKDIVKVCKKYEIDEIIIAMPSATGEERKQILNECKKTKCKTRILPGVYELIDAKIDGSKIRDVQIEDLLGRDEVRLDLDELCTFLRGKRVMVTGGGGSIGSELCRQIAKFNPGELIILDIYENNAYDIQNELLKKYPSLNLTVIIDSVRDKSRLEEIFSDKKPQILFHAAAHKHVPLMESNPKAAIKNNVFGTLNMARMADKYKLDKFVLISTDKAVNPTNVMGTTKRICEIIIQTYNTISETEYVAVRFGNVLGSNGSVIPLFKKQIAEGGPVTVTDERIIRFFMTIPEACQLVLQAGSIASGGEIFVLDMGEPVKIIDLAKDLIRLSGFEVNTDIPIKITGLRPGEKLYEEILLDENTMIKTKYEKIYVEQPMIFSYDKLMLDISMLERSLEEDDSMRIKNTLAYIVPTYKPYNDENIDLAYKEVASSRD